VSKAPSQEKRRIPAAERLIVALDYPTAAEARELVAALTPDVRIFKIGLELIYADGLPLAKSLAEAGHSVFLDAKLSDIPNTVEHAAANAARLGASFLTVHGTDRKTLDAAVRGRANGATKLLAITVLTSLDAADIVQQGITGMSPEELVVHRARLAKEAGFDGAVASAREAAAIRAALGQDFLIVTPGIRPAGAALGDQARAVTPAEAIAAGADYLVVGRPINAAPDPRRAAHEVIAEIAGA
jgi:orotidine-5'-phosphate decarboxylase